VAAADIEHPVPVELREGGRADRGANVADVHEIAPGRQRSHVDVPRTGVLRVADQRHRPAEHVVRRYAGADRVEHPQHHTVDVTGHGGQLH
jgi:hypothetical protein